MLSVKCISKEIRIVFDPSLHQTLVSCGSTNKCTEGIRENPDEQASGREAQGKVEGRCTELPCPLQVSLHVFGYLEVPEPSPFVSLHNSGVQSDVIIHAWNLWT